jgi:hypothetical protein
MASALSMEMAYMVAVTTEEALFYQLKLLGAGTSLHHSSSLARLVDLFAGQKVGIKYGPLICQNLDDACKLSD